MNHPVSEHIVRLESRLEELNARLMLAKSRAKANKLEVEIRAMELVIRLYKAAMKTERSMTAAKADSPIPE